eukprot:scaffold82105_cov17-Prasinocladus_malaysianus.AAC.1
MNIAATRPRGAAHVRHVAGALATTPNFRTSFLLRSTRCKEGAVIQLFLQQHARRGLQDTLRRGFHACKATLFTFV